MRESGGIFNERLLHTGEVTMPSYGITGSGRRKDDVTLPVEGGWRWDGDWEVDLSWAQSGMLRTELSVSTVYLTWIALGYTQSSFEA